MLSLCASVFPLVESHESYEVSVVKQGVRTPTCELVPRIGVLTPCLPFLSVYLHKTATVVQRGGKIARMFFLKYTRYTSKSQVYNSRFDM